MMKLSSPSSNAFPIPGAHSKTVITIAEEILQHQQAVAKLRRGRRIKTGRVAASGYNIVTTAKRGDSRNIAGVLGGRSRQIRNRETKKIMEACFTPAGQKTYLPRVRNIGKQRPVRPVSNLRPVARATFWQPPETRVPPFPARAF
jgi:D-alanyl-D-alanine carboxypeptidase